MKKVEEPLDSETCYECPRCGQMFCDNCQPSVTVDFSVLDKSEGFNTQTEEWKDREVCPYCYNQLIDLRN